MSLVYNGKKIDESNLHHCAKCDCLIISDSTSGEPVPLQKPKPPLKTRKEEVTSSGDNADTSSSDSKQICRNRVKICLRDDCCTSDSENKPTMKHICFKFCGKKKQDNKEEPKNNTNDDGNQTSQVNVESVKAQNSKSDLKLGNEINETVEKYVSCKCPTVNPGGNGGGNTNTIIFPRDSVRSSSGDNNCWGCLQGMLKCEVRCNRKLLEDIGSEMNKQRREISDMRDMLDMFLRMMREHLFMMSSMGMLDNKFRKALEDNLEAVNRNSLERKSNTLSINGKKEPSMKISNEEKTASIEKSQSLMVNSEPQKPKKKGFFSWCK